MKSNRKIQIFSWALVLLCMAVIFILSAQTGDESQSLSDGLVTDDLSSDFIRTCAHFLEYAGLSVLIYNALYRSYGYCRPYLTIIISSLYAVSDEVHQLFVPGRSGQISDVLLDSVGALLGVFTLAMICRLVLVRRRK